MNKEEFYVTKDGVSLAFNHFNNKFDFRDDKVEIKTTYIKSPDGRFFKDEKSMRDWDAFEEILRNDTDDNNDTVALQYLNKQFFVIDQFDNGIVGFAGKLFRNFYDFQSFILCNPQYGYYMMSNQVGAFGKRCDVVYPMSSLMILDNILPYEEIYISIDNIFDYCNLSYWLKNRHDICLPGGEYLTWGIDDKAKRFNEFKPIIIHLTVCEDCRCEKYKLNQGGYLFDWEKVKEGDRIFKCEDDIKQIEELVDKFKSL